MNNKRTGLTTRGYREPLCALVALSCVTACGPPSASNRAGPGGVPPPSGQVKPVTQAKTPALQWRRCAVAFNKQQLATLARCFTTDVRFFIASDLGKGKAKLQSRFRELWAKAPSLRVTTRFVLRGRRRLVVVVEVARTARIPNKGAKGTSRQIALVVLTARNSRFSSVGIYMDNHVVRPTIHSTPLFAATGSVQGSPPRRDVVPWLRSYADAVGAGKPGRLAALIPPDGSVYYASQGEMEGKKRLRQFFARYVNAATVAGHTDHATPVLRAGDWVVALGEWRPTCRTSQGSIQGLLAQVRGTTLHKLWLFDPILSLSAFKGIRQLGPRH